MSLSHSELDSKYSRLFNFSSESEYIFLKLIDIMLYYKELELAEENNAALNTDTSGLLLCVIVALYKSFSSDDHRLKRT